MERNYGIDLFRIVSMFMVVVLHVVGQGGVLSGVVKYSEGYWIAWVFEIFCYCAVDCFALISGYVGYNSKAKFSKLLELWLQTIFYTLLSMLMIGLIFPGSVTQDAVLDAVLPITRGHYWYISAYFGMYILTPLLNMAIKHTEKKAFLIIIAAAFLLFSLLPTFLGADPYGMKGGYSMMWLCILYLVGGFIAKYNIADKIKTSRAWGIVIAVLVFTFLSKFIPEQTNYLFFGLETYSDFLISYTSPTVAIMSVALLIIFSRLTPKKTAVKIIKWLAPASLGVYLIHVNKLIWEYAIKDFAKPFADGLFVLVLIPLSALTIYLICSIIELGRLKLFSLTGIRKMCVTLEAKLKEIIGRL